MTDSKHNYVSPIDMLLPELYKAAASWKAQNTAEKLTKQIHKTLDKHREEVVMKLLGFNTAYRRGYELDHCNGRSGNSAAGDYLREHAKDAIQEWLEHVELPTLDPSTIKNLQKSYIEIFLNTARKCIQLRATEDAKEFIHDALEPKDTDKYLKMLSLLGSD